jgi:hypothetical protein
MARTDDADVHVPDRHLVPCDLCGSLAGALVPAPECDAREPMVCGACARRIEDENRAEAEADWFDSRQHIDEESLR